MEKEGRAVEEKEREGKGRRREETGWCNGNGG
jgi:hypothetical protein